MMHSKRESLLSKVQTKASGGFGPLSYCVAAGKTYYLA